MTVKCVRRYQSSDGKLHESEKEARKHDAQFSLLTDIKMQLDAAGNNSSPSTTHISLLNKPELAVKMRDALNKVLDYHRNYTGKVARKIR